MEFWTSVRVLIRRWYVFVPSLLVFGLLGVLLVGSVAPTYDASGSVVLLNVSQAGDAEKGPINPFQTADYQANQFALIMEEVLTGDSMRDQLEAQGVGRDYKITNATNQTPVLFLTVTADSAENALASYATLLDQLRRTLDDQQSAVQAPTQTRYSAVDLTRPSTPEPKVGSKVQAALFIGVIGVVVSIGLTLAVESLLSRKQGGLSGLSPHRGAPAGTASGDGGTGPVPSGSGGEPPARDDGADRPRPARPEVPKADPAERPQPSKKPGPAARHTTPASVRIPVTPPAGDDEPFRRPWTASTGSTSDDDVMLKATGELALADIAAVATVGTAAGEGTLLVAPAADAGAPGDDDLLILDSPEGERREPIMELLPFLAVAGAAATLTILIVAVFLAVRARVTDTAMLGDRPVAATVTVDGPRQPPAASPAETAPVTTGPEVGATDQPAASPAGAAPVTTGPEVGATDQPAASPAEASSPSPTIEPVPGRPTFTLSPASIQGPWTMGDAPTLSWSVPAGYSAVISGPPGTTVYGSEGSAPVKVCPVLVVGDECAPPPGGYDFKLEMTRGGTEVAEVYAVLSVS